MSGKYDSHLMASLNNSHLNFGLSCTLYRPFISGTKGLISAQEHPVIPQPIMLHYKYYTNLVEKCFQNNTASTRM